MTGNPALAPRAVGPYRHRRSRPVRGGGFTLLEMLVVIAIIMILLCILVPSVQSVKKLALNVMCKSNLSHLGQAFKLGPDVAQLPSPWTWIQEAEAVGAAGITSCPMGGYEDGGSGGQVATSGAVTTISPPPSVVFDDFESSTKIFMFTEQRNFPLPQSVTVDITRPGYYERNYNSSSKVIGSGMPVDCHFVFFDPVGSQSSTVSGAITMGTEIIGIICTKGPLDASDSVLGLSSTRYDTGHNARNFENGAERITLSEDMRTITINNFHATHPGENMRILANPGSGGAGSFAMNGRVNSAFPHPEQILLIGYNSSVVYPDSPSHVTALEDMEDEGRLHLGRHLNGAMTDGSVKSFTLDLLEPESPVWYSH